MLFFLHLSCAIQVFLALNFTKPKGTWGQPFMEYTGQEQMHQLDKEYSWSQQWNNLLERSVLNQWA